MNRPGVSVRLAGHPPMSAALFILCAFVVMAWWGGSAPWWLALAAVASAGRTMDAYRRMRSYKAWLAEWRAMGGEDEPPRPPKKSRIGDWVLVAAVLLVVAIPMSIPPGMKPSEGVTILWGAACLYLVFALVRGVLRRTTARRKAKAEVMQAKAEAAPVAWLLPRASSSPSRAVAERSLPEYCARLIEPVQKYGS